MRKRLFICLIITSCFYLVLKINTNQKINIACIGDSNTEGHGLFPKFWFSYPSKLQLFLGNKYRVYNYGEAGSCVASLNVNNYLNSQSYKKSLSPKHDYFIFLLGTNDSKNYRDGFLQAYENLLDNYDIRSKKNVIICTPPIAFSNKWGIQNEILSTEIRRAILKIAVKNDFKILDIQSEMKSEIYYQNDGIHFNAKGTEKLAQILKNKLFNNQ
tara:strand:- start:233 stop:874 length:642 start_codon:yes stop_codon:yes gene_type:complete